MKESNQTDHDNKGTIAPSTQPVSTSGLHQLPQDSKHEVNSSERDWFILSKETLSSKQAPKEDWQLEQSSQVGQVGHSSQVEQEELKIKSSSVYKSIQEKTKEQDKKRKNQDSEYEQLEQEEGKEIVKGIKLEKSEDKNKFQFQEKELKLSELTFQTLET